MTVNVEELKRQAAQARSVAEHLRWWRRVEGLAARWERAAAGAASAEEWAALERDTSRWVTAQVREGNLTADVPGVSVQLRSAFSPLPGEAAEARRQLARHLRARAERLRAWLAPHGVLPARGTPAPAGARRASRPGGGTRP